MGVAGMYRGQLVGTGPAPRRSVDRIPEPGRSAADDVQGIGGEPLPLRRIFERHLVLRGGAGNRPPQLRLVAGLVSTTAGAGGCLWTQATPTCIRAQGLPANLERLGFKETMEDER